MRYFAPRFMGLRPASCAEGALHAVLVPAYGESGRYYVVVTGGNMAYTTSYPYNASILKSKTINMASNSAYCSADVPDSKLTTPHLGASLSLLDNVNMNIKVENGGANALRDPVSGKEKRAYDFQKNTQAGVAGAAPG